MSKGGKRKVMPKVQPTTRRIPAPPLKKGGRDSRLPRRGPQYGGYK